MRVAIYSLIISVAAVLAGCKHPGPESLPTWEQNKTLTIENQQLKGQLAKANSENTQLKQQVQTLSTLDPNARKEAITEVATIELYRMTGVYVQNGKTELVVYLTPRDNKNDPIKAAGTIEVQLWNLSSDANALLQKWEISPQQLSTVWGSTLFSSFYRVALPISQAIEPKGDYVVRVTFTDYLTGKVLSAKKTISGVITR